ncbi:MAG: DEAD/DEAH box helicase [Armatimonadetes bacterium]|nr:DEAD/DEAH box helicase [Armatimonadota bacterium]
MPVLPLSDLFPFPLDSFQLDVLACMDAGESVLVCAPTGSGKTVIAEYAIHLALQVKRRVFYTTPLKALSNQKFRDLGRQLGEERVGLLTGDVSLNRDAPVVVMTTEVFRNMLYGTTLGAVETNLKEVQFVILDEVHYMNDAQRGTVWEESIIYCPQQIQIVALSATVANPDEMRGWMHQVHGATSLITSDHRPVPLRFHYFDGRNLTTLIRPGRKEDAVLPVDPETRRRGKRWEVVPEPDALVQVLAEKEMLPAIYFVFSRKGCDQAMLACGHLQLLTPEEYDAVESFVNSYVGEYPSAGSHPHIPYLFRGLAVHHAGLLPTWKVLVERLFQAGLVKVVFATETLAAGINMPARSTVLSNITKRGDLGIRMLTASEFLQMSGRAGRRGMDRVGHVTVVASPRQTRGEAQALASAPPDPLGSQFTPTYGMVLNLLQRHTLEECEYLILRSFGQYLDDLRLSRRQSGRRERRPRRTPRTPALPHQWRRFLALKDVLERFGYVEANHPTPPGVTAAAFRAEHELLIAEALFRGVADTLSPAQLAGVATALVSEELRPSAWVSARPLGRTAEAIQEVAVLAREIRNVQRQFRVEVPTRVFSDCSGLAELWTNGAEWFDLLDRTNLDEGDLVRVFRRAMDLLEQIAHAPGLDEELQGRARQAIRDLDREPVREIL